MSSISTEARILFCRPNCIGLNKRLKIIFRINGVAIFQDTSRLYALYITVTKVIAIIMYSIVHTGPNTQAGGAQSGFINASYQEYVFIYKVYSNIYVHDIVHQYK